MRTIEMIEMSLAVLSIVSSFAIGMVLYTHTGEIDLRMTDIKFVEGSP